MADAREVVERYFERVLSGGDLSELLAEDLTWWVTPGSPMGGTYRGRAAVLELLERALLLYRVETMHNTLETVISEGGQVCVVAHLTAVAANGNDYENRYVWLFEVEGDRITSVREMFDTKIFCDRVMAQG